MESLSEEKEGFVRWFSDINRASSLDLGQKGRSLFELHNLGLSVPACFIISSKFYNFFIKKSNISGRIDFLLNSIDFENFKSVEENSSRIRDLFLNSEFPEEVEKEILEAYDLLNYGDSNFENLSPLEALSVSGEPAFVAVRSSLVFDDIIEDDFSCQQDSYLNIKGKQELIKTIKKCISSIFTSRAIYYRKKNNLDYNSFSLAIVVQRMVDSDKSGVVYSNYSKEEDFFVESSFGLGEGITSGQVTPDKYFVSREMEIKSKDVSKKNLAFTRDSSGSLRIVKLKEEVSIRQVLSDYEINRVCEIAYNIEKNFGYPVELEFAIESKEIFVLQFKQINFEKFENLPQNSEAVLNGLSGSFGLVVGNVKFIKELPDLEKISSSDIVVIDSLFSELIIPLQKAKGIVCKNGGFSSCLSVFCRQNKIPCVLGIVEDINLLNAGEEISLDGFSGKVFRGKLENVLSLEKPLERILEKNSEAKKIFTKTKFKFILDSKESNEFCKNFPSNKSAIVKFEKDFSSCGKHPLFFENSKRYDEYSSLVFDSINRLSINFSDVWISFSDFRGDLFGDLESYNKEENPFLGNHGIRFLKDYTEIFRAEVKAIKRFSDSFSGNLGVIIPFVSNVSEIKFVKDFLISEGLNNIRVGVFLQTPASVQIIKEIKEEKVDLVILDVKEFSQGVLTRNLSKSNSFSYLEEISILRQIEYLLRFCKREKVEAYLYMEEIVSSFNRFLVEREINGIIVSPSKYSSFFKEFSFIEGEIFKDTDKEPRLYEIKKQGELF